ncbi:MAG: HPF/RaiA family ribosome-associated protein [Vicinamibacterales bacterium]
MQQTPRVTFRGFDHSDALVADITEHIEELETYYPGITGCHVLVELPEHHRRSGNRFHVRIKMLVPGEEIVVSNNPDLHADLQEAEKQETTKQDEIARERRHVHVAVREAFEIARRRLQDYGRRRRGFVKTHASGPEADN